MFIVVCCDGYLDIVKYLIYCGVDVNLISKNRKCIFLVVVCRVGYLEIYDVLVVVGVDISEVIMLIIIIEKWNLRGYDFYSLGNGVNELIMKF